MTISEWLDEKEAEGVDVSQIVLPDDLSSTKTRTKLFFLKRLSLAGFSATAITHFLLSSVLALVFVEVKTRKPVFTLQEWSGDYLQKVTTLLSEQRNCILNNSY